MQKMHIASDKPTTVYSLDVIISVGYRVKSRRGVQFRQWATRVLREHLVRGYTFNQTRLAERGLLEARQTLDLLARTLQNQALVDDTGRAVLELIVGYAETWRLLLEYDEDRLALPPGVRSSSGVPRKAKVAIRAPVLMPVTTSNSGRPPCASRQPRRTPAPHAP